MTEATRTRRIEPAEPGGEAICLLTPGGARERSVPVDRLLQAGSFRAAGGGYEVHLPRGEGHWALANAFIEEEAACCPSFAFEVRETDATVVVLAGHPDVPSMDGEHQRRP
jgi:hypothetical protein